MNSDSDSNKNNLIKKTKHLWLITSDEATPYEYHISTNNFSLAEAEKIFKARVFASVNPVSAKYIGKVFTMEPKGE
jgi:hypothetical protein